MDRAPTGPSPEMLRYEERAKQSAIPAAVPGPVPGRDRVLQRELVSYVDEQTAEELRARIEQMEDLVRFYESRMEAHPKKLDNPKKGTSGRNFAARAMSQRERDKYGRFLTDLKARLDAALGLNPGGAPEVMAPADSEPGADAGTGLRCPGNA